MDPQVYLIAFENVSAGEANRFAEELRNALLDSSIPAIEVERKRHDPRTLDTGQILQVILDASSITALVTVIGNWLVRRRASLTFKRPEGDIIATNINDKTVTELTRLLVEASKNKSDK